jgi:hypothetical protein
MTRWILCILLLTVGCSPLKRFTRLVEKYPYLLTQDTLIVRDTINLYIPEVHTDTVVTIKELTDTITITQDRVTVKAWYVPKEKKVYIQGKCDPVYITKIVERKIPVKYYEKYPWWKKLLNNLLAFLIIFVIIYIAYRLFKMYFRLK